MPTMDRKPTEQETLAGKVINAANQVLMDAGITDKIVTEVSLTTVEALESGHVKDAAKEVWGCYCWDCVTNSGPRCICNGPACDWP